ncbi:WecB/TagA/CpsF family glycosyltransferase, partial [Rhizobium ruizarguesonis]
VWALKRAGPAESDRVYGPDLMLSVFDAGSSKGLRHFLYGATAATLEQLQARLLAKFPQARIVGTSAPPFRKLSTQEETDIADRLSRSGADIIWGGLSSPKQELWMARMRDSLQAE